MPLFSAGGCGGARKVPMPLLFLEGFSRVGLHLVMMNSINV